MTYGKTVGVPVGVARKCARLLRAAAAKQTATRRGREYRKTAAALEDRINQTLAKTPRIFFSRKEIHVVLKMLVGCLTLGKEILETIRAFSGN